MKLSEVRPCVECGGPIAPMFYVFRISQAMFNAHETNMLLDLRQMSGGSLVLAEVMGPDADAVIVLGDEKAELMTELLICQGCVLGFEGNAKFMDILALMEKVNERGESSAPAEGP